MLREVEFLQHVVVPKNDFNSKGMVPTSTVVSHLLRQLTMYKALQEYGYILAVTKLKTIGNGEEDECTKYVNFLVSFSCRTLLPMKGEFMFGIVHTISRYGVFLKSGPMKIVYLSTRKMPNYYFVNEGKPLFLSNDLSRIEKDVVIRFVVLATRWSQRTRDINVLASIEGDSLGPVATAGLDGINGPNTSRLTQALFVTRLPLTRFGFIHVLLVLNMPSYCSKTCFKLTSHMGERKEILLAYME